MKRIFFALLSVVAMTGYAQVKPSIIGFSPNLTNFSGSQTFKERYDPGFSIMYWKGIAPVLDFSVRYNGVFSDYTKNPDNSRRYINESEGSLHVRPIADNHFFSPFLSAGVGVWH